MIKGLFSLRKRLSQRGDTLVEVLVSIVVLSLVVTTAYLLSTHSLGTGVDAQRRSTALSIANGQIAQLQNAQTGLTNGLSKYINDTNVKAGNPFCIDTSGTLISPPTSTCQTTGGYNTIITYNQVSSVFTIRTTWSKASSTSDNSLTLYWKAPSQFTQNDVCPPPAGPPGVQLTVPPGYHLVNGQCQPNGGSTPTSPDVTPTSAPPHCQLYSYDPPWGDCSNGHCGSQDTPGGCPNISPPSCDLSGCYCTVTISDWNYAGTSSVTQNYYRCGGTPDPGATYPPATGYTDSPDNQCAAAYGPGYVGDYPTGCHQAQFCYQLTPPESGDWPNCQPVKTTTDPNCVPTDANYNCQPPPGSPGGPNDPSPNCSNGATNSPACNICPYDAYWDGSACTTNPPSSGGGGCFVAGTEIWTPEGYRAIETINRGDSVMTWDFKLGRPVASTVTDTYALAPEQTLKIITDHSSLTVTPGHLLWNGMYWQSADRVTVGSKLIGQDGSSQTVLSISAGPKVNVFNFHVANPNHNYFANGLIVHNVSPPPT